MGQENMAEASISAPSISLVAHHLRFTVRAATTIVFHDFKGSALRGAIAGYLKRTYCPEWRAERTDPLHQAICPICQLLSYELTPEDGGDIRRPFALQPPLTSQNVFEPGESFAFGITLFGNQIVYLPYLILAVQAVGEDGLGARGADGRRGRFQLEHIESVHLLNGARETLWSSGSAFVQTTTLPITHVDVLKAARELERQLQAYQNRLAVVFLTPTRLIQAGHTVKSANFFPFVKQVVLRVLDLCAQYGEGRPDIVLKRHIFPAADAVQLVRDETEWWDVAGYSSRLGRAQRLGGLIGTAIYQTRAWSTLLPWLMWGTIVQVGKNVVKGCGVCRLSAD